MGVYTESNHLWMVFWKQREELSRILQLSEYSHIPVKFSVNEGRKLDKKVSLKCGWCVISKHDFENKDKSTSHNPLSAAEQHNDQAIRTAMLQEWESRSRSISFPWPNIKLDFWKHFRESDISGHGDRDRGFWRAGAQSGNRGARLTVDALSSFLNENQRAPNEELRGGAVKYNCTFIIFFLVELILAQ